MTATVELPPAPIFSRRAAFGVIAGAGAGAALLAPFPADAQTARVFASTRMSVVARGTRHAGGHDVIWVHGLGGSRSVWDATVAALPGHRHHLVQIAGFGGTAPGGNAEGPVAGPVAAEIARYIRATGLNRPAVIGHSMGGIVAMMVGTRFPASVGRVMVVDILPAPASAFGLSAGGSRGLFDGLRDQFLSTPGGRRTFQSLMSRFGAAGDGDPDVTANALHELANTDLGPALARLTAPLTVVYAAPPRDEVDPRGIGRTAAAAYARAPTKRLVPIEGAGHMVMLDRPREFQTATRTFLR